MNNNILWRLVMLKKALTLSLFSLFIAPNGNAMSFEDVLCNTLKNNSKYHVELEKLKQQKWSRFAAGSAILPTLDVKYAAKNIRSGPTSGALTTTTSNALTTRLSQLIFDGGGTILKVTMEDDKSVIAKNIFIQATRDLLLSAIDSYLKVIHMHKILELQEKNHAVHMEHLKDTSRRFEAGEASRPDVLQAEQRLGTSLSTKLKAEGDYNTAIAVYKRITGGADLPSDNEVPNLPISLPSSMEESLARAGQNNLVLKTANDSVKIAKKSYHIAQSSFMPVVKANAKLEYSGKGTDNSFASKSTVVDLEIGVPIFQGGGDYAKVRTAKSKLYQAGYERADSVRKVEEDVLTSYSGYQVSLTRIPAAEKAVEFAVVALDAVKQGRDIGTRTFVNLLDAEKDYVAASIDLFEAKKNLILSSYKLKSSLGEQLFDFELDYITDKPNFALMKYSPNLSEDEEVQKAFHDIVRHNKSTTNNRLIRKRYKGLSKKTLKRKNKNNGIV